MTGPIENSADLLDQAIDLVLSPIPAEAARTRASGLEDVSIPLDTALMLRDLRAITEVPPPRAEFVSQLGRQLMLTERDTTQRPQREAIAEGQVSRQRARITGTSRRWANPIQLWQAGSSIGRLGAAMAILLLILGSALIITGRPSSASAAEILKRASEAGSFVPTGKIRHIVTTTTSDSPGSGGGGSETEEVWLSNGTEHLLMWQPAPAFSSTQATYSGYSLLVNDEGVWQFNATENKVYKVPYQPGVFSSSGTLPDPQVIESLLKSSDTHIVGAEALDGRSVVVVGGHVGSFVAGNPLDIAEGRAKGYDTAQHDFKLWVDKDTYQIIQEQHYITWDGIGPGGQHMETITRRITTDELLDAASAPSDLFTFKLPAGATVVDVASLPTPPPVELHTDWYTFASNDGHFSVLMPRTPDESSTTDGLSGHTELMYGAKVGPVAYVVRYADYPPDVIQRAGTDKWLDSERDYLVISVPGKLVSEQGISINGYPGRELRILANDGKFRIARLYLVKDRLYKVYAVMPDQNSVTPQIEQFLNSFKLLEP